MADLFSTTTFKGITLPMPDAAVTFDENYVNPQAADQLFQQLRAETPWREVEISIWGKKVMQPRLIAWYGDAGASYKYSGARFEPLVWTAALSQMREVLEAEVGSKFNSVLLNLYRDQNDSM